MRLLLSLAAKVALNSSPGRPTLPITLFFSLGEDERSWQKRKMRKTHKIKS
jgi:hypothetical protein